METIGQRIVDARQRQQLTRRALARRAGLHETHLAKVERNERPRLEAHTVLKLARALGCTTDYLLGLSDLERCPEPLSRSGGAPRPE